MRETALFGWPVLASLGAHVTGLAVVASMATFTPTTTAPAPVPIDVVRIEAPPPTLEPPTPPSPRPRAVEKVTPPRLVSKPQAEVLPEAPPTPEPLTAAPLIAEPPRLQSGPPAAGPATPDRRFLASAAGPGGPVPGARSRPPAALGRLFATGDLPVAAGRPVAGAGQGRGPRAAGRAESAEGASADKGAGSDLTAFARPLGGYQTKPRYPDTARRQGVEGVTTLRFAVLANGRVGEVTVANSAGHPDLDRSAVEAVKTWLFEPARRGKEPVKVWVTLPVRFTLQNE
jgi:protein TonB